MTTVVKAKILLFTNLYTKFLRHSSTTLRVNYSNNLQVYAPSLTSLRERDWTALIELFDRDDGDEIEADIDRSLFWLIPEPCWEDDPFDFLREYL